MRKITLGLILCSMVTLCFAGQRPLEGFKYASEKAPVGNEWESPENIALNKEQPRAWFFSFQDVESARKVLPENSKYWLSLNGHPIRILAPKIFIRLLSMFRAGTTFPSLQAGISMVSRKMVA